MPQPIAASATAAAATRTGFIDHLRSDVGLAGLLPGRAAAGKSAASLRR